MRNYLSPEEIFRLFRNFFDNLKILGLFEFDAYNKCIQVGLNNGFNCATHYVQNYWILLSSFVDENSMKQTFIKNSYFKFLNF